MKAALALVLAALVAVGAAGCAAKDPAARHGSTTAVRVTPETPDRAVELAVGQSLVFVAPENPTTGYVWVAQHDAAVLEATSSDYSADPAEPGTVGGGGTRTMTFTALAPGKATLALSRQRPTVPGSSVEDLRFGVTVR